MISKELLKNIRIPWYSFFVYFDIFKTLFYYKENIKEHFLEDGFSDYLLINNIDSELERIIEKY